MRAFSTVLAEQRRQRRMSQSKLSLASGVSQRHISFLESGRAAPGRSAVMRLAEGLMLGRVDAEAMMAAAGFSVAREAMDWDAEAFGLARDALELLIRKFEPYPALVCDQAGTIVRRNAALDALLNFASPDAALLEHAGNLYDLTLHPDALPRLMINAHEIVPHTILRLRRAAVTHAGAAEIYRRVSAYPAVIEFRSSVDRPPCEAILVERYRAGAQELAIISTTSSFGSPESEIAQQIQIELFLPGDSRTSSFFEQRARSAP